MIQNKKRSIGFILTGAIEITNPAGNTVSTDKGICKRMEQC